ncbi:ABC transporter substrate-binding protein [bacterium]|nr:ABC transporter substrate-binding protein [bacterium]
MKRLLIVLFLISCTSVATAETVRLAQFGKEKFLFYLPLYIAMEQGYFEEEGIEIALSFVGNDDQVFATLVSGSADFAMGDPIFTAIAAERGFQAKTIALMAERLALSGYTSNRALPLITSLEQLEGLRLSSFPAPSTTYTLLSDLRTQLRNNTSFSIVEAAPGTALHLLHSGRVDIAIDLEPAPSVAEAAGNRVVFSLSDFTEPQAITGLMASDATLKGQPALARKMVRALQRGLDAIHTAPHLAHTVAAALFPTLGKRAVERSVNRLLKAQCYPRTTVVSEELWDRSLRLRQRQGDLRELLPLERAVENRFAQPASSSPKLSTP